MSDKPFSEEIHNDIKDFFNELFLLDLQEIHKKTDEEIKNLNDKYTQIVKDIGEDYKQANEIKQKFINAIDVTSDNDSSFIKQLNDVWKATQAIQPIDSFIKSNLQQITIDSDRSVSFPDYTKQIFINLASVNKTASAIQSVLTNDGGDELSLSSMVRKLDGNLNKLNESVEKMNKYRYENPLMPSDQLYEFLNNIVTKQNRLSRFITSGLALQIVVIILITVIYFVK